MIRRLNYTGRQTIHRENVEIRLSRSPDGVSFVPHLHLGDYGLPGPARIYVEAYHRTQYMRFSLGVVDHIEVPRDCRLTEFHGSDAVRFRIKVVDETGSIGR